MPQNTYSGGGSPFPTGRSPLVLDIENNIQSVVQQRVENKKREIAEKRVRVTENEQSMLDALDAQSIEGVSDKVALEFGNELESLSKDWAKKFYEKGGELNTQDKLELNKAKRNIETKLKSQAADIKAMADVQKELQIQATRPDKKGIYDFEKTSKWLSEYSKSGKAGSGQFLNGVVFAQPEYGEDFKYKYNDAFKKFEESTDTTIKVLNPKTGLVEEKTVTRDQQLDNFIDSRPESEELKKNPVEYAAFKEQIKREHGLDKREQKLDPGLQRQYNSGLKEKASTDFLNDFVEGVARGQEDIIKQFKGMTHKEIGIISDAGIEDGELYLFPASDKFEAISFTLPKEDDTPTAKLAFKRKVLSGFNQVGNTDVGRKQLDAIQPEWGDNVATKPSMPISMQNVLTTLESSPKGMKKEYQKDVIDGIKKNFPNVTVERAPWIAGMKDNGVIRITEKGKEPKDYDLTNEKEREELSDWVVKNKDKGAEIEKPQGKQDITETEYAKLKTGDKYWFGGEEYTKE